MQDSYNKLTLPVAIVIAGVLVAGAIIFSSSKSGKPIANDNPAEKEISLKEVNAEDHILGNPNADVIFVEYSDLECPFCKLFHATMHKITEDYAKQGNFAWVYRHFPLDKPDTEGRVLHSKAGKEAQATECAAEIGGQTGFWNYIDRIFQITPSNNGLDLAKLPQIAEDIGLDRAKFEACLASGKYASKIEEQYQDGTRAGAQGTPYSVIVTKRGDKIPITLGALPYNEMKKIIDAVFEDLKK